jgi:cytochrome c553
MADFRDGRRQAINAEAVHQSALSLEDQALKEIAAYLGALERP